MKREYRVIGKLGYWAGNGKWTTAADRAQVMTYGYARQLLGAMRIHLGEIGALDRLPHPPAKRYQVVLG